MAFNIDEAREQQEKRHQGEWKECRRSRCELLMVPASHPDFRKVNRAKEKNYRAKAGLLGRNIDKPIPMEVEDRIFFETVSEVLIKDWRGVETKSGSLGYSSGVCFELLDSVINFRLDVMDLINAEAERELESAEIVEKN